MVDPKRYLVLEKKEGKTKLPPRLAAGVQTGEKHPQAASGGVKKERKEPEESHQSTDEGGAKTKGDRGAEAVGESASRERKKRAVWPKRRSEQSPKGVARKP